MRKIFNSYRDATTPAGTIAAKTLSTDFANVGVVTHLVLSWVDTYTSGTQSLRLSSTYVDLALEGHGKIIDQISLQQLAGIVDIESGGVLYTEGAASTAIKLQIAIPIGKIDLWDDVLKLRIPIAAQTATMAAQTLSASVACLSEGYEMGAFLYERQTFAFDAANQRLEKDLRSYGYDRVYLDNFAGGVGQFEVTPKGGTPSYGYAEALEAFTYTCTRQEFPAAAPTAWNKMLLAYDSSGVEADSAQLKVAVIAAGSADVDVVTRRRWYRPQVIAKSRQEYSRKVQNSVQVTKQLNPQAIVAKQTMLGKNYTKYNR